MDAKHVIVLALQVSIICTVFGFGLKAAPDDLLYLVRRPSLLLRSVLSILVVMPVLAVLLTALFDVRQVAEISVLAIAISPIPPLLPQREAKGGGQRSYGLALMVTLSLLAIVTVPLWAEILQRVFNRPLHAEPASIARVVLMAAVVPLIAGVALRRIAPAFAKTIEKPVALGANVLLMVAGAIALAGTWRAIFTAIGGGTVAAMIAFVAAGLGVGHLLGGPDPEHSVVLALSTACRHPAIALSLAASDSPQEQFAGTIILYLLLNLAIGMPYVAWVRRLTNVRVSV